MQVSAPVWFGNSGGGAFNDEGEIVGIASFIMKGPSLGFFIPVDSIRPFLAIR
jgi:S1-C subfamily serine protease